MRDRSLADNTDGAITPSVHRALLGDLADSVRWVRVGRAVVIDGLADGSVGTVAHGLGAVPDETVVWLDCTRATAGYTAGDRVFPAQSSRYTVHADATNVGVRNINLTVVQKNASSQVALAARSWRLTATPILWTSA